MRRSLNDYQSRLEVVHRGLDRKNRRLWKLAHHDSLTGCLNRRAFEDDWRHILELSAQRRSEVSLILIDCNHFKAINDSYGHSVGDEVLKGVALTVRRILDHGDRLYRIASDEFAVIFVDAGHTHSVEVGRQCLASIDQHGFTQLGVREPVSISVGIACSVTGEPEDLQALYRRANVAMFRAKRPEQPGLAIYSAEMEESAEIALSSEAASAVDQAIADGSNLCMYYQPVFSLPDRQVQYYESLVRLRVGERIMAPEEFFLQISARRLDTEFDEAVFDALARELAAGRLAPGKGLSINVTGASLVDQDIEQSLSRFEPYLSSHKLLLEVTETTMITQLQLASRTLSRLRERGFSIALDDFGSGYSSLRHLADMPVDVIKFDISLVHALCDESPRGDMLARLVDVLRNPGYKLVAEGVETEQMAARVTELGFDFAQGFLLGRPQPLD